MDSIEKLTDYKSLENEYLNIKYIDKDISFDLEIETKQNNITLDITEIYNILFNHLKNHTHKEINIVTKNSDLLDILEVVYNALGFEVIVENLTHTKWSRNKQAFMHTSESVFEIAKQSDDILNNLSDAMKLYLHEDNLNWTKLGMLVSFTFAFMTAFFVFFEQKQTMVNLMLETFVFLMGLFITYMFYVKLKSGIHYMDSHKKKVKKIERILQYYKPNHIMLIETLDSEISGTSKTVEFMKWLPIISYIAWPIFYLLALYKFFT